MLNSLRYIEAKSLHECFALLDEYDAVKLIAGGTDLFIEIKEKRVLPTHVIGIKKIPELNGIEYDCDYLYIFPCTTHTDIIESNLIKTKAPILFEACQTIGSIQTRNIGTIGGNICNASPGADCLPPLLALEARFNISHGKGNKELDVLDFLIAPFSVKLEKNEILTKILIPNKKWDGYCYMKFGFRNAMELAVIGVAVLLNVQPDSQIIQDINIAIGACGPIAYRAVEAEKFLTGKHIHDQHIIKASKLAMKEAKPRLDSLRANPWYRLEVGEVTVRRAIQKSLTRAFNKPS